MIGAIDLARAIGVPPPTAEQVAVIEAPLAPTLVIAGAGSGKTETMAARVAFLVANGLVLPEHVLGLTFTRKAASGLAQRIRVRLRALSGAGVVPHQTLSALSGGEPEVSTYHSFGGRVISEFGPLAGIEPTSRVLTATGSWRLARRLVSRWDGDLQTDLNPDQVTEKLLATAGALADHLSDVGALANEIEGLLVAIRRAPPSPRQRGELSHRLVEPVRRLTDRLWILPLVDAFSEAKRSSGLIDFADQMQLAANLVTRFGEVGTALRSRYQVVLLDEYQDTGHAQRVILRALFGRRSAEHPTSGHPVTAVGDPVQSIYSWRGASASNLPRFSTDFPLASGRPSATLALTTSFRNAVSILDVANTISAPIRTDPVTVGMLGPRESAPVGEVRIALFDTVLAEEQWLAGAIADYWAGAAGGGRACPTTAVLVRRRRDMDQLADAILARGIPVEVVGIGGLLAEPEIADLLALLTVLVDPTAGAAALRLLTNARWRLGMADLDALSRRASVLAARPSEPVTVARSTGRAAVREALAQAKSGEDVDQASLVDAISDPGERAAYSAEGWRRLGLLADELGRLRGRLGQPLPDLIADLERTTRLDIEVKVSSRDGRVHLDAFADIVSDLAASGTDAAELVEYLAAAVVHEDGLVPGEPEPVSGRVQILTVHAAKGLEWEIVAVPHLSRTVFPNERVSSWLSDAGQLPTSIRGDREDLPELCIPPDADQKDIADALERHTQELKAAAQIEERRLWYVAATRAEQTLLLSGHHWDRTGNGVQGPSEFLEELAGLGEVGMAEHCESVDAAPSQVVIPEHWAPRPTETINPLTADPIRAIWPVDPLSDRRLLVQRAADQVLLAVTVAEVEQLADQGIGDPQHFEADRDDEIQARDTAQTPAGSGIDRYGWARDVEVLLAERRRAAWRQIEVELPGSLSATELVQLAGDPEALARRLRRPVPAPPTPGARRGTAFHAWVERYYGATALLDLTDLPGAMDAGVEPDSTLDAMTAAFERSEWAAKIPKEIEMAFGTVVAGIPVRGRIDAVFGDADGGLTVVDWKTGKPPAGTEKSAAQVQLAVYRLAAAALFDVPVTKVRACFVYVGSGEVVAPVDFLDADGLSDLIHGATRTTSATDGLTSVARSSA